MDTIFNFSASPILGPLLLGALAVLVVLVALALHAPHLARIGLRNVPRRPLRTLLIVAGLMLSTTFVAASLAIDDTITQAVRSIAVFNLGRIDEDVTGGGRLGLYSATYGDAVTRGLAADRRVAGVAPTLLVQNVLIADETTHQARGGVNAYALDPAAAGPLADLRTGRASAPIAALAADQIYLNNNTATLLGAHNGDTLTLYATQWPGERHSVRVRAIVSGGPLGDAPAIVLPLASLQQFSNAAGQINHIYVANTGDGLTGVGYSDDLREQIEGTVRFQLRVHTVKQDGVEFAVRAQDIFGRILTLYTLFALAIGLLLIFLIFVLLAAERRSELGMARAVGMRREHIVRMLLFEGGAYDLIAAAFGIATGLAIGVLLVQIVSPTLTRIGFPLRIQVQPQSMVIAFSLGLLFTLATIWLAAWTVSRMTVAAALRDLPEPPAAQPSLMQLARSIVTALLRSPGQALGATFALLGALVARGIVPLVAGWVLLRRALDGADALLFSLALSLLLAGAVLALRWLALAVVAQVARRHRPQDAGSALWAISRATLLADRATTVLIGAGLALYWSLPFDALQSLGLPRFSGGIQVFFIAGVMMVFGLVWALAPNLDLLLAPLCWLLARVGNARHVTRIALVYPSHHRFRTGVGLTMFSLVCFTMVVMACIAASATKGYDDLPSQAAQYDIAGQPLFSPVGGVGSVSHLLSAGGQTSNADFSAISSATPLPLALLQPGAPNARWSLYPTSQVQGAFLDGVGLPLVARAQGYADDAAVWRAVRGQPGNVVIDAGALSRADADALGLHAPPIFGSGQFLGPPIGSGLPGLSGVEALHGDSIEQAIRSGKYPTLSALAQSPFSLGELRLQLRNVVAGGGSIASTPLWVADLRGGNVTKLTIVGVVDNPRGHLYGLFGSQATFAASEQGLPAFGNDYYYFKLHSGVDVHSEARALGSALSAYGFETTVLQDVLLDTNGPRVFISRVLVGLVGLTLLIGMAALAVTGSRAVVERRQQIGMLRALGFHRSGVQAIFLIESVLVGAVGTLIGLALGLLLCRNIFAVDFFAPIQSGLVLVVPWGELGVICLAALSASALAALVPAWQAGHVAPADALRYE